MAAPASKKRRRTERQAEKGKEREPGCGPPPCRSVLSWRRAWPLVKQTKQRNTGGRSKSGTITHPVSPVCRDDHHNPLPSFSAAARGFASSSAGLFFLVLLQLERTAPETSQDLLSSSDVLWWCLFKAPKGGLVVEGECRFHHPIVIEYTYLPLQTVPPSRNWF